MPRVLIPAPLRPLCGSRASVEVEGATLGAVFESLEGLYPGFRARVLDGGRVRPELAVAIDGEAAAFGLHEPVSPGAEVAIIPAIGGGQTKPPA